MVYVQVNFDFEHLWMTQTYLQEYFWVIFDWYGGVNILVPVHLRNKSNSTLTLRIEVPIPTDVSSSILKSGVQFASNCSNVASSTLDERKVSGELLRSSCEHYKRTNHVGGIRRHRWIWHSVINLSDQPNASWSLQWKGRIKMERKSSRPAGLCPVRGRL